MAIPVRVPAITAAAQRAGRPAPRVVAFVAGVVTADAVRRYIDAGATEVVFIRTELGSAADQRRTWSVLGELAST